MLTWRYRNENRGRPQFCGSSVEEPHTALGWGCDLHTVWHAAFLMGHFDHCHSARLLLHAWNTKTSAFSRHSRQSLLNSLMMAATVDVKEPQQEGEKKSKLGCLGGWKKNMPQMLRKPKGINLPETISRCLELVSPATINTHGDL